VLTIAVPARAVRAARQAIALAAAAAATAAVVRYAATPASAAHSASAPPAAALETPLRAVATDRPDIALTFDISWGNVMPAKVIAILERERVAATWFLSGPWVTAHPDLVRAMARVPYFEIESHGQAHVNFSALGSDGVRQNLEKANAAIYAVTGRRPTMVRPPNGDYSRASLTATAALGLRTVIWDTDSRDWMNPGVAAIVRRVVTRAHPGDIVLMHASDTCKQTDLALPAILSDLRAKGYRFVTVAELLRLGRPLAHSLR
jgi:polysaccharide deacetylase family sporulation protein PdaB